MKIMEVCGTHTMAIARSGIKNLLPKNIELISGPGCPVCVTSQKDIDKAVEISCIKGVIMATFGDMMRVPGSKMSLEEAKSGGADVRIVYSCLDALEIARKNPKMRVVFMGIGFETTSPTVAATILKADKERINNFFVLSNFKLIFPALEKLMHSKEIKIDGFMCPGHVSVITGTAPYEGLAKRYRKPCVITGFGDADILKGIKRLLRQIRDKSYEVEIGYERAVRREGNREALKVLHSVFRPAASEWRGLGRIEKSGLAFIKKYSRYDAAGEFKVKIANPRIPKGCLCGDVIKGVRSPTDCRLFRRVCTPLNPVGPCMVSSEGTCAAYYKYSL